MAVGMLVSVEEYLHTSYHPDCDYVDGEVQERNLGEKDHSKTQGRIYRFLCDHYPLGAESVYPELRIRVRPTRFRIPDVCVLSPGAPDEQVPTHPPILCVEVLSPEDRMSRYLDRVNDYFEMGVPVCWIIDPAGRRAWVATPGHLDEATDGILRSADFEMPLSAIFE